MFLPSRHRFPNGLKDDDAFVSEIRKYHVIIAIDIGKVDLNNGSILFNSQLDKKTYSTLSTVMWMTQSNKAGYLYIDILLIWSYSVTQHRV